MLDEYRRRPSRASVGIPTDLLIVAASSIGASMVIALTSDVTRVVASTQAPLNELASAAVGAFAAIVLLLFLPGYSVVAAVFPNRPVSSSRPAAGPPTHAPLDPAERLALSFGASVVVLPLLGIVVAVTPLEFAALTNAALVTTLVVASAGIATVRGHVAPLNLGAGGIREFTARYLRSDRESRVDLAISTLLAASIVLAIGTLAVTVAIPIQGETFTGFSVLAPTEDGLAAASSYPTTLNEGDAAAVVLVIENHERTPKTYSIVVNEERVTTKEDPVVVIDSREHARHRLAVAAGESGRVTVTITPTMTGPETRFGFFLYQGVAPADAGSDTAYRHLYLWVDVRTQFNHQSVP